MTYKPTKQCQTDTQTAYDCRTT